MQLLPSLPTQVPQPRGFPLLSSYPTQASVDVTGVILTDFPLQTIPPAPPLHFAFPSTIDVTYFTYSHFLKDFIEFVTILFLFCFGFPTGRHVGS